MGSVPIYYYQPLLQSPTDDDDADERRPSVRRGRIGRSASARRLSSCEEDKLAAGGSVRRGDRGSGSVGGGGGRRNGDHRTAGGDSAWFKRCQTAPGYVSFEDVIGGEGRRPPDHAPGIVISDPLVRTASQLYARETATSTTHHQPRHLRRSPGPLGTRRGGPMYRLVKKYVSPCLGFLAAAFFCGSADASATSPIVS